MLNILLFIVSFILLFLGGELLVKSAVALSLRMRVSTLVVGMTVVSLGTSSPELFVSLQAVLEGSSNIAFGNVIGSNIANISLVLGVTAIIFRVNISKVSSVVNYPVMFFVFIILGLVLYIFNGIPSLVGGIFILLLVLFSWVLFLISQKQNSFPIVDNENIIEDTATVSLSKSIFFLVLGVFCLKYGADFLVNSTKIIAANIGISDRIIAVTIVAIGTSIPELATSIVAALRKEEKLAVGNLIGSNIFNILAVLGITAFLKEMNIMDNQILTFDYLYMLIVSIFLGLFIYISSKNEISRGEGFFLIFLYIFYLFYTFNLSV